MKDKDKVLTIRLPEAEAEQIRQAAYRESRSVNNWCRLVLSKVARDINRLPKEAD